MYTCVQLTGYRIKLWICWTQTQTLANVHNDNVHNDIFQKGKKDNFDQMSLCVLHSQWAWWNCTDVVSIARHHRHLSTKNLWDVQKDCFYTIMWNCLHLNLYMFRTKHKLLDLALLHQFQNQAGGIFIKRISGNKITKCTQPLATVPWLTLKW